MTRSRNGGVQRPARKRRGRSFRTNDEMGGDSTGATYFPTKNEGRGVDYEEYPPADHHAVEHKSVG